MPTGFTLPKQVPLPKTKDALASRFKNDENTLRQEFFHITVRDLEQRYKEDHLCKHSKAEISHKEAFTKQLLTWLCHAYTELEATDSEVKELAGQHLAVYNKKWDADVAKDRQRIRTTLEAIDKFWEMATGFAGQEDPARSRQKTLSELLRRLEGDLNQLSEYICGNPYEMNASSEVADLKRAMEKSICVIDLHSWNLDDPEPQWPEVDLSCILGPSLDSPGAFGSTAADTQSGAPFGSGPQSSISRAQAMSVAASTVAGSRNIAATTTTAGGGPSIGVTPTPAAHIHPPPRSEKMNINSLIQPPSRPSTPPPSQTTTRLPPDLLRMLNGTLLLLSLLFRQTSEILFFHRHC